MGVGLAERLQNVGTEYFRELIAKSHIDQVDVIAADGVTIAAKRRYSEVYRLE